MPSGYETLKAYLAKEKAETEAKPGSASAAKSGSGSGYEALKALLAKQKQQSSSARSQTKADVMASILALANEKKAQTEAQSAANAQNKEKVMAQILALAKEKQAQSSTNLLQTFRESEQLKKPAADAQAAKSPVLKADTLVSRLEQKQISNTEKTPFERYLISQRESAQSKPQNVSVGSDSWNRWTSIASLDRQLTDAERSEAKSALDALNYSFQDASKIQLFGTAAEKQEYRNRLALAAILENKTSASSAAGAGLLASFLGVSKAINTANKAAQSSSILDQVYSDKGLKTALASNNSLEDAQRANTAAFSVGNVAGSLIQLGVASGAVKSATSSIKGFTKLPRIVQAAINSGATFGSVSGLNAAGDDLGENATAGDYASHILKETGIGAIGGAAGSLAGSAVGALGKSVLTKYGLQTPFAEAIRQTLSGTAFAGGNVASTYYLYPEGSRPTNEQIAQNLATAFIFSAAQSAIGSIEATKAGKEYLNKSINEAKTSVAKIVSPEMSNAEKAAALDDVAKWSAETRSTITGTYYAGQQKTVNEVIEALDALDEQIGVIKTGLPAGNGLGNNVVVDSGENTLYNQSENGGLNRGAETGSTESGRDVRGGQDGNIVDRTGPQPGIDRSGNLGVSESHLVSGQLRSIMTANGISDAGLKPTSDNAVFSSALEAAKSSNPQFGPYVESKTTEDLSSSGAKMFLSSDGFVGVAVEPDGNITAVFKNPKSMVKLAVKDQIITALSNGGNKLDCYVKSGPGLNLGDMYAQLGFEPVAYMEFDPSYVPGWNTEANGTPIVVFWKHSGDSPETVAEKSGSYKIYSEAELRALPKFEGEDGYADAMAYRDSLMKRSASVADTYTASVAEQTQNIAKLEQSLEVERAEFRALYAEYRSTDIADRRPELLSEAQAQQKAIQKAEKAVQQAKDALTKFHEEHMQKAKETSAVTKVYDVLTEYQGEFINDSALSQIEKTGALKEEVSALRNAYDDAVKKQKTVTRFAKQLTESESLLESAVIQNKLDQANAKLDQSAQTLQKAQNALLQKSASANVAPTQAEQKEAPAAPKTLLDFAREDVAQREQARKTAAQKPSLLETAMAQQKAAQQANGKTNDGVGAMNNPFPQKQATSKVVSNTFQNSPMFTEAEKTMATANPTEGLYDVVSEKQSMANAAERLSTDFDGEVQDLTAKEMFNGEDVDTSMGILEKYLQEARARGDYRQVAKWRKLIKEKGTALGQGIQAFAKYSRTPEGVIIKAGQLLENADVEVTPEFLGKIDRSMNAVNEAQSAGDLVDLIVRQSKQRNLPVSRGTLKRMGKMPVEWLRGAAEQQVAQMVYDKIPSTKSAKLSTWQAIAQLFSGKTIGRNLLSNAAFGPVDDLANNVAILPDSIFSIISGKRTVGFSKGWLSKASWKEAVARARRKALDISLAIDTMNDAGKYETKSTRTFKPQNVNEVAGRLGKLGALANNAMSTGEKALAYGLNVTDEFAKGQTYGSIYESLTPLVKKGTFTDEEISEVADEEARYRTYQDNTFLSNLLAGLKAVFNLAGTGNKVNTVLTVGGKKFVFQTHEFGAGDFVQKYTRVPGALITRSVEFSPVGYFKLIGNLIERNEANAEMTRKVKAAQKVLSSEDANLLEKALADKAIDEAVKVRAQKNTQSQRKAALTIGRATTGIGLICAAVTLAKLGILMLTDEDDDARITAVNKAEGKSGLQINLSALGRLIQGKNTALQSGDTLTDLGALEPFNSMLAFSVAWAENDTAPLADRSHIASAKYFDEILDIPTMRTFKTIFNADDYGEGVTGVAATLGASAVTGMIPAFVRQTAQATDNTVRYAYTSESPLGNAFDVLKTYIPGARSTVPAKLSPYGKEMQYTQSPILTAFNTYLSPGNITNYTPSANSGNLEKLYANTGDAGIYPRKNVSSSFQSSGEKIVPTLTEAQTLRKDYGQKLDDLQTQIFKRYTIGKDDEALVSALKEADETAMKYAREQLMERRGDYYLSSGDAEKLKAYSEAADISENTAYEIIRTLDRLEPESGSKSVTMAQKADAVLDYSGLSGSKKAKLLGVLYTTTAKESLLGDIDGADKLIALYHKTGDATLFSSYIAVPDSFNEDKVEYTLTDAEKKLFQKTYLAYFNERAANIFRMNNPDHVQSLKRDAYSQAKEAVIRSR